MKINLYNENSIGMSSHISQPSRATCTSGLKYVILSLVEKLTNIRKLRTSIEVCFAAINKNVLSFLHNSQ